MPAFEASCLEPIDSHEVALELLVSQPCIDRAIEALERFARNDPKILSDLAAAYYIRSQREDYAPDLLTALDAAQRAVAARPRSAAAWFNRALIEETIGLRREAIASFDRVSKLEQSDWSTEALGRRRRLIRETSDNAFVQWTRNYIEIRRALGQRDVGTVARLIEPFPRAAVLLFEEGLLPEGHPHVRVYAAALSARLGNDSRVLDIAGAAPRNHEGHVWFRQARIAQALSHWAEAASAYERASRLLRRGGSPLHFEAEIGRAICLSNTIGAIRAAALLSPVEAEARRRNSQLLAARVAAARGYVLIRHSYIESIRASEEAASIYERLRDWESCAGLYRTIAGNYHDMGQQDLAFREALLAQRHFHRIVELRIRHVVNAETARPVMALGAPGIAMHYQQAAVEIIRRDQSALRPSDTHTIEQMNRQLASAFRGRADIEIALRDFDGAAKSLGESIRLSETLRHDPTDRRTLAALQGEVQARALLAVDPARAAAVFRNTLGYVKPDERWTFRASLLSQEARALRLAGRQGEAEAALRQAIAELRKEERRMLGGRQSGEAEAVWSAYFARFRETHNDLIRQLADTGREDEAFAEAERSRAIEPLDLILTRGTAPAQFRALLENESPIAQRTVQKNLPHGTFLLQYAVTRERTYVWVVSFDSVRFLRLDVSADDVDRWRNALQRAARARDEQAFNDASYAPFDRLIAEPLGVIRGLPGGGRPRLVIIPDVPMQGLPFAALRDRISGRYLIEDGPIEIAGSATLYVFALIRANALQSETHSALLVGNPAFDQRLAITQGVQMLPGAEREVERIRAFYAPRVDVLIGAEATVARFLELGHDKTIVHVAGHSIVNPRKPAYSLLLLAKTAHDSGVLEAPELLEKLRLDKTRLVVLSACSSAGGLPVGPEGVASLVRPLIAAGVPAVVGSLWDVEDATTEDLLVSFHDDYRQRADAAAALRAAQLSQLRNSRGLRSLLVWAPFQVIGH